MWLTHITRSDHITRNNHISPKVKPRATKSLDVTAVVAVVLRTLHCSLLPASPSGGPIQVALQAAQGPGPPLQNVGVELHNLNKSLSLGLGF